MKFQMYCILIIVGSIFLSCKKDYVCVFPCARCDDEGFIIHNTKSNARKQCKQTVNQFKDGDCYIEDNNSGFFK